MERIGIRTEERTGLIIALALHLALLAALVIQAFFEQPAMPPIERMTVSLAEDVGLEDTAPDPVQESSAAIAPELGELPTPAPETPQAPSRPVEDRPAPTTNTPRPERPSRQPEARPTEKPRGSRIGDNFLAGAGDSTTTNETRIPASQMGASATASLRQAINRQIKPHWSSPSGVEADQLISVASWRLNEDGSLNGTPTCKTLPESITDSNRPQVSLHCERAIRAIRQAAPFDLPPEYYDAWKNISAWRFDRRL